MKKILISLIVLAFSVSCHDQKLGIEESVVLKFFPRKSKFAWADFIQKKKVFPNGHEGYVLECINNNECKVENLQFIIYTSSIDTIEPVDSSYNIGCSGWGAPYSFQQILLEKDQDLDAHNIELEKQLEADYLNSINSTKSTKSINDNIEFWEYRTNGIADLTITCNKKFFGQSAGSILNPYFYIDNLKPHQIISSATEELIFGYRDDLNKMSIQEWLDMRPMAQPSMYFMLNEVPDELPGDFKFIFKMETATGVIIEDTTREIRILP